MNAKEKIKEFLESSVNGTIQIKFLSGNTIYLRFRTDAV